jgi:hypothetical protein
MHALETAPCGASAETLSTKEDDGMRSVWWMLGMLAVTSAGLSACSSDSIANGTLGFTVAESLLVLYPEDPTFGVALLSEGTGTCAALQSGVTMGITPSAGAAEVAGLEYLYIPIEQVDVNNNALPLAAATYTVFDPTVGTSPPGFFALVAAIVTDDACDPIEEDANSGTLTISPFDTTDGGSSSLNYSAVFGGTTQVSGTYTLTTCLVSLDAGVAPGTCVQCVPVGDAGACAIQ